MGLVRLFLLFLLVSVSQANQTDPSLYTSGAGESFLTQAQKNYLMNKKVITMCVNPNWMPLEKIEEGEYIGVAADFIAVISKNIHTPIELVQTQTWSQSLQKIKSRECDILPMAEETAGRERYLKFTIPYIETPLVVLTKIGRPFVNDLNEIKDRKLGIVVDHAMVELLREKYKNIDLIEVDSVQEGVEQVRKEKLFGFLDNAVVINHVIQKNGYEDVSINGQFEEKLQLSIATRSDEPELYQIMQAALGSLDKATAKSIMAKWNNIKYQERYDYGLIAQIIFITVLALGVLAYWALRLKEEIKKKDEAKTKLRKKTEELEDAKQKLEELNNTLEKRVKLEIEKNLKQQILLLQQNRLVQMGEMIENIAHQWRQPLAQINSCILILDAYHSQGGGLNEGVVQDKFSEIEALTAYMSKTIDDFKNFFNPDKQKEVLYLHETIRNAHRIVEGALKINHIQIEVDVDKELKVSSYVQELEHVFIVILNNAKDALISNDIKDPRITIASKEDDRFIKLKFCDNGLGIRPEIQEKIFEPYFTTKHKSQGTGLGLYMAKMIIEEGLKGHLFTYNENGGACFELGLPKGGEHE